ncbi:hypothetical protein CRYUN_Cryun09bG0007000 [Craigia yunnanensis]
MATINVSPLSTSSSSLHRLSSYTPQSTPILSFSSRFTPSLSFPSISLRHTSIKPRSLTIASALKNLLEVQTVPFPVTPEEFAAKFPSDAGVYAVFDKKKKKSLSLSASRVTLLGAGSLLTPKESVPELCSFVKVGVVNEPDRTAPNQAWKSWMEEHIQTTGKVPPGNESGNTNRISDLLLGSRSAPMCGFSQRVVAILESQGVDYESVDVLDEEYNSGLRETFRQNSNWPTFPQVFCEWRTGWRMRYPDLDAMNHMALWAYGELIIKHGVKYERLGWPIHPGDCVH